MHTEIERKFLVRGEYKHLAFDHKNMEQGYFATEPGRTVRVRISGEKGYLTIKGPSDDEGLSRYEFETEVPIDDAREMMKLCMPGSVRKTRWLVKAGSHVVEVDEFFGDNQGLVLAEIELNSENETFERPDFLGQEVTGVARYYNKYLIKHPYKSWNVED